MLVELTDIKGEVWWVNPLYVRMVREKKGKTEIWVTGHSATIKVERPAEEVAAEFSAALQGMGATTGFAATQAAVTQAEQAAQAATGAAINPAMLG